MSKLYKVIDLEGLGTLAWTHTFPTTTSDIAHSLTAYHQLHKNTLATSQTSYLPTWGAAPKLSDLLKVYNLKLEEA